MVEPHPPGPLHHRLDDHRGHVAGVLGDERPQPLGVPGIELGRRLMKLPMVATLTSKRIFRS